MSTDFITPVATETAAARSPLADASWGAGGVTNFSHGWELAAGSGDATADAAACREGVGFADLSPLTKLELQAPAARLAEAAGPLELGSARQQGKSWHCPVRPELRLELHLVGSGTERREELEGAGVRVLDLTGSLAAIAIAGPLAREAIARFCALDTRPGALPLAGFRPGSIARTPGYLLCEGEQRFLLLVGAAYGRYLWDVVADAAGHLGGRPVAAGSLPATVEAPHA